MVGYSMLSTMLMGTMVAPSWRLNMMGRPSILTTMGMGDMNKIYRSINSD